MYGIILPGEQRMSINGYRNYQIKVLEDFGVTMTKKQREHMEALNTEVAISNYKLSLLGMGNSNPQKRYTSFRQRII